jgi:hypothetical protein
MFIKNFRAHGAICGSIAILLFAVERLSFYGHIQVPWLAPFFWLMQLSFFLLVIVQWVFFLLEMIYNPDKQHEGIPLLALFFSAICCIFAVPAYHALLNTCNFIAYLADKLLP